jgi:hypothetical protein
MPEMSEESMPGKRYVSLSALSGIFCRLGGNVLSTPEAREVVALTDLERPEDKDVGGEDSEEGSGEDHSDEGESEET